MFSTVELVLIFIFAGSEFGKSLNDTNIKPHDFGFT